MSWWLAKVVQFRTLQCAAWAVAVVTWMPPACGSGPPRPGMSTCQRPGATRVEVMIRPAESNLVTVPVPPPDSRYPKRRPAGAGRLLQLNTTLNAVFTGAVTLLTVW